MDKVWWSARSVRCPAGRGDLALIGLDCLDADRTNGLPTPIPPRVLGDESSPGKAIAVVTLDEPWLVGALPGAERLVLGRRAGHLAGRPARVAGPEGPVRREEFSAR